MSKFAALVFYDGTRYHGFQQQKGYLTVEETLSRALKMIGASPVLSYAGRTDAGVSALHQVITFECDGNPRNVNSFLPRDITVWGLSEVDGAFNPRKDARYRVYRYFYPSLDAHRDKIENALKILSGEHDFSGFCKKCDSKFVISLEISYSQGVFEFRARNFRWEMIRRIISTLESYINGKIDERTISSILEGKMRVNIPPAAPEPLILWYVDVPIHFTILPFAVKRICSYISPLISSMQCRVSMFSEINSHLSQCSSANSKNREKNI